MSVVTDVPTSSLVSPALVLCPRLRRRGNACIDTENNIVQTPCVFKVVTSVELASCTSY